MSIAVKIEDISKYYKLGVINNGTLWQDLQSYLARLRKIEDPNLPIGQTTYDKKGFWALSGINLEIEHGDRVGVMGINGAGKSTLLKILSRITAPTNGCFHIKGRIASLLEVGTGFHPELTGRENIYMNGAILGMKRRTITRKLDEIIEFSGIEGHHIDTPVKRYSSGMYVRLGFAIAAHLDYEIMITDEVLAVGDINFRQKAVGKMNNLSKNDGRTIIFVSHALPMVKNLCNKGVVIDHGKLIQDLCPVKQAIAKYKKVLEIG